MNNKISTGIWLVFIGGIILLHNLNIIDFNFYAIIKYWPLAIVSVGVSLLLQNRRHGALISTICNVLICGFIVLKGMTTDQSHVNAYNHDGTKAKEVHINYEPGIDEVNLNINGGATSFYLVPNKVSEHLFYASTNGMKKLKLQSDGEQSKKITLDTEGDNRTSNNKTSKVEFSLHTDPFWDLDLNLGATSFKADFSPFKIKGLEINSGASSMNIKLGQPVKEITKIEINTGASSISMQLPKDAAYQVETTNILSSTKLEGAKKTDKGEYQTDNYESATHKYRIELNGAANSFSLKTY